MSNNKKKCKRIKFMPIGDIKQKFPFTLLIAIYCLLEEGSNYLLLRVAVIAEVGNI